MNAQEKSQYPQNSSKKVEQQSQVEFNQQSQNLDVSNGQRIRQIVLTFQLQQWIKEMVELTKSIRKKSTLIDIDMSMIAIYQNLENQHTYKEFLEYFKLQSEQEQQLIGLMKLHKQFSQAIQFESLFKNFGDKYNQPLSEKLKGVSNVKKIKAQQKNVQISNTKKSNSQISDSHDVSLKGHCIHSSSDQLMSSEQQKEKRLKLILEMLSLRSSKNSDMTAQNIRKMIEPQLQRLSKKGQVDSESIKKMFESLKIEIKEKKEMLKLLLQDKRPQVRRSTVETLPWIYSEKEISYEACLELLKPLLDDASKVCKSTLQAVAQITLQQKTNLQTFINLVKPLLRDPKLTVRTAGLYVLLKTSPKQGISDQIILGLTKPLLQDRKVTVRVTALGVLQQISSRKGVNDSEIMELLKPSVKDQNLNVRTVAMNILSKISTKQGKNTQEILELIKPLLKDEETSIRTAAWDLFSKISAQLKN